MKLNRVILIAHNIRSAHNVGSLLRTAEGLGIECVYFTGHTPHPTIPNDQRLPHIQQKDTSKIKKTALGAELTQKWEYHQKIETLIYELKVDGFTIAALEQDKKSLKLPDYESPDKIALIVGREVEGLEIDIRKLCDIILEIPMKGKKESFNVAQAAAMALYQIVHKNNHK